MKHKEKNTEKRSRNGRYYRIRVSFGIMVRIRVRISNIVRISIIVRIRDPRWIASSAHQPKPGPVV